MSLAGAKGVERPSEHRLGVLFEISIVCHVLCSWFWRGVGVSLFFGGLFWLSVVFSRASGVSCVSRCSAPACWGWGAGCGGFRGSGSARPGVLLPSCWGAGLGCVCARPVPELSGSGCGRGRWSGAGVRVVRLPAVWWGSGCARFLLLLVVVGVFGCCFFPSGASRVLLVSGVGLRGLAGGWGLWGVSGWVRGCFFSGFCCTGPGLFPVSFCGGWFGFGLGFVWRV